MTLYALFTSNEAVSQEKDGSCAELNDFDWQGEIREPADSLRFEF